VDGKYIAAVMVGRYLGKHINKARKAAELLKVMASHSKEYLVLVFLSAGGRDVRYKLLEQLMDIPEIIEALAKVGKAKQELG